MKHALYILVFLYLLQYLQTTYKNLILHPYFLYSIKFVLALFHQLNILKYLIFYYFNIKYTAEYGFISTDINLFL